MTLAPTAPQIDYTENGSTLVHVIPFQFEGPEEIVCWRISDGVRNACVQGLDYSVSGGAGSGGTVTKTNSGTVGGIFRIQRVTSRAQDTDFATNDSFPAQNVELCLDRRAAVEQEVEQNLTEFQSRVLRVGFAQTIPQLPAAAERADHYFLWDPNGGPAVGISSAFLAGLIMPVSPPVVTEDGFLRPEQYGAVGDGITSDNAAMQAMATIINAAGGGGIALTPKRIYMVGAQDDHAASPTQADGTGSGNYRYTAQSILSLANLNGFTFRGNGGTLKTMPGLRHGAFNADGTPMASADGYQSVGAASAYGVMLFLDTCQNFTIDGLVLNGNGGALNKGGPWGDTGWQVGGTGMQFNNCSNGLITNCWMFGHPSDGLQVAGAAASAASPWENMTFINCVMELNGRQGMSLIGGRGHSFKRCSFNFNGKGDRENPTSVNAFVSNPASGVDVEPESVREVHEVTFTECVFACNHGTGFLYPGGGASKLHFDDCVFIGDVGYALYCAALLSGAQFTRCLVVGISLWQGGGGDKPAQFTDCHFLDSGLSPTGQVYDAGPIMDLGGGNPGVLFERAKFDLTGAATLPSGAAGIIYRDTTLSQANTALTGIGDVRFEGHNEWTVPNPDVADIHIQSASLQKYKGYFLLNGGEVSVQGSLLNFHGARIRGYDGVNQQTYRLGKWSNPVDWATSVGGASKGDVVISTLDANGGASIWECITAPGTTDMTQWRPLGIKGLVQAATVPALATDDTLATVIDRFNTFINNQRAAHMME